MKKSVFVCAACLFVFFLARYQPTIEATELSLKNNRATEAIVSCPNDSENYAFGGRIFREEWLAGAVSGSDWVSTRATVLNNFPTVLGNWESSIGHWTELGGRRVQQTDTSAKVNILYGTTHDVADGIIETCLQLLTAPPVISYFPHGVAFRVQEENGVLEGYGVGFIDDTTLALGVLNNNNATVLASASGFVSTDVTQIQIELIGNSIKIYAAQNGDALPTTPTMQKTDNAFQVGKIGLANYATQVEYGSLTVDYDCSADESQLSTIENAVYQQTGMQYFCDNHVVDMLVIPARETATSTQEFIDVYTTYANLIANAQSEVLVTAYLLDRATPNIGDQTEPLSLAFLGENRESCGNGNTSDCNGLARLHNQFANSADGIAYPDDVHIRILVGDGQAEAINRQADILTLLKEFNIPLYDVEPNTGAIWRVDVARIHSRVITTRYFNGKHSHAKFLVVDGQEMIVSGFNFSGSDRVGEHDVALHVRGPVVFEIREKFDRLWHSPFFSNAIGRCEPNVVDLLNDIPDQGTQEGNRLAILDYCGGYTVSEAVHPPSSWAIYAQPEDDQIFSLYRDNGEYTADNAHIAALEAATDEILIIQDRFSTTKSHAHFDSTFFDPNLPFAYALKNAIVTNHNNDNSDFQVQLLVAGAAITNVDSSSVWSGSQKHTKKGIEEFIKLLDVNTIPYFEVRIFATETHAKTFSADDYVVIGSHNWDMTGWDRPTPDLVEYSLGTDAPTLVSDYKTMFTAEWALAKCIDMLGEPDWVIDIFSISCPYGYLDSGNYMAESIPVIQPVTLIGGGQATVILPNTPGTLNEVNLPIFPAMTATIPTSATFRILSSDVTISDVAFRDSGGYAIEIGDGVTPIENIVISNVFFENNALGAIKINGLVKNWIIQNNTIVGGQAGIVIDSSTVGTYTHSVRNNIFADQGDFPIVIESADDGRTHYGHNLFYNCNSAADGSSCDPWITGTLHISSTIEGNLVGLEPLFEDDQNHDFDLTQRSPAIDSGDPASTHELDFDGEGDNYQRVDIGASEFFTSPVNYDLALVTPQPTASLDLTDTFKTTLEWAWVSTSTLTTPVRLQLATDSAFSTLVVDQDMAISGTYTTTLPDGNYYWRGGFGSPQVWTPIRKFSVTNSQNLQAVSGVSVEAGSAVTLTWPSTGADQYEVWFSGTNPYVTPNGDCMSASNCAIVTEPMFIDTSNGQNRFYSVIGANTSGFFRSPVNQIVGVYRFMLQPRNN